MKKLYVAFLILSFFCIQEFTAVAQTTVTETTIVRQNENTTPTGNSVGYARNGGLMSFTQGPGVTPQGCGSLQFATPTSADKAYLYNYDHNGKALSTITALSYSTNRTSGSLEQVAAINIQIDFNGPNVADGFAVLIFEPVYNQSQGTITDNIWQTWDAFNGGNAVWWSSKDINGVCAFDCQVTWNQILASNPDAVIYGGFGINQGSGNTGLVTAVDALTISTTGGTFAYNFEGNPCAAAEPEPQPTPEPIAISSSVVYPNPSTGDFKIRLPESETSKAEIIGTNTSGTVVFRRECEMNGQVEVFNLSGIGQGIYLIQVITDSKVESTRVIVQ